MVQSIAPGPQGTTTFTGVPATATARPTVGRVLASGADDAGFGGDGRVEPLAGTSIAAAASAVVAPSGDGRTLAAGIAADGDAVSAFVARLLALAPGAPFTAADVRRIAGTDRVGTAIELSRDLFASGTSTTGRAAGGVVLASSARFPDALVGAPYAASLDGPLLLNGPDRLDARVRAEIDRVLPDGGTVTLLGGLAALGIGVETELRAAGFDVVRIAGNDRFETSVQVAEAIGAEAAVLARGDEFPDALAAGPAAAQITGAVLLTDGTRVPPAVAEYLEASPDLLRYAVGGQAAAADPDAEPLVGRDRYATAALVAQRFFHTPPGTVVASGLGFPDALAGGARAALTGSPLLLATQASLPATADTTLRRGRGFHRSVVVAGGTAVLADGVLGAVDAAVG